ncbi:hypothetical protein HXZ66_13575 [Bacillus sp. A116_S68]|jgi:chromosome segregation ATPase|nr:hypothetical protein HXZ66_13575 [Bacillus sp. A116_S68]
MKTKSSQDPVQLQQQVIYFKSELAKFKDKVKHYQNDYHYSQIEKFKMENSELIDELQQVRNQLAVLKTQEERLLNENQLLKKELENLHQHAVSYSTDQIDELTNENTRLKALNDQLTKKLSMLEQLKTKEEANAESPHLQQIENQMDDVLEKAFAYEEQLDSKMILIQFLEGKLEELSEEINQLTTSEDEDISPPKENS